MWRRLDNSVASRSTEKKRRTHHRQTSFIVDRHCPPKPKNSSITLTNCRCEIHTPSLRHLFTYMVFDREYIQSLTNALLRRPQLMFLTFPVISSSVDSTLHYLTPAAATDPTTESSKDHSPSFVRRARGAFVG